MKFIKKLFFTLILFSLSSAFSQKTSIGVTGGLLNGNGIVSENNGSASSSDTGFYLGVYSKIQINEKFSLIPEIDYGNLNDRSFGFLSTRIGYYIVPKLFFQAGPQVTYLFDVLTNDVRKAGIDLGFGLGYEITDKVHLQARYAFEVSNRIKEPAGDLTARFNWLHIGVGYSF